MLKFWRWVRKIADDQWVRKIADDGIKAAYMKKHGCTNKCPNCQQWSWEMPDDKQPSWEFADDSPKISMTCKVCEHTSHWFDTGFMGLMVPWEKAMEKTDG
jgi:hypothetical protein